MSLTMPEIEKLKKLKEMIDDYLKQTDNANLLWIDEMNIPVTEKALRIEMIDSLETEIFNILQRQKRNAVKASKSNADTSLLLALIFSQKVTESVLNQMSEAYTAFADNFYSRYVNAAMGNDSTDTATLTNTYIDSVIAEFPSYIEETTETEITKTVQNGIETGKTNEEIAQDIENSNAFSFERARNIARTETNKLANLAKLEVLVLQGYMRKMWRSFRDERVRTSHRAADGQTVGIDAPFAVGNSLMLFPCDSSLGADLSEIVNCRCTIDGVN